MSQQPAIVHLWEIDHPYYCAEGNYFKAGQHTLFESWADFTEETTFYSGDRDLNLLIRWDWKSYRRDPDLLSRDEDAEDELLLFFVLQRKAWLCSAAVTVTDDDEPAVRAWLAECAQTMRATWEPLLDDRTPVPKPCSAPLDEP
ncbi:hypothetical protein [Streptomyces sp. NPDC059949]|uniref:hypothetical protein n=1 Tax=Streptomyces sp. NPDC059949 TaxID=3347013 RepID=UPI00364CB14F